MKIKSVLSLVLLFFIFSIAEAKDLNLSPEAKNKLAKNGFVIVLPKSSKYYPRDETLSIYSFCKDNRFPVFVSSDVILHVSHLLFDWSLRFLEISSLKQDLLNLTDSLLSQSLFYYDQVENKELKQAALKNAIFFNIAKALLTEANLKEVPKEIKEVMEKELALIDKRAGQAVSPLFGYQEDYSQYLPRGHYTRSPEFEKYFKAMTWYGRMIFRLTSSMETRQALLIDKALIETKVKGEKAIEVWKRIYETTSFFAGRSDELTVEDYKSLMDKIFEKDLSLANLNNEKKMTVFVQAAKQFQKPKVLSIFITDISSAALDWKIQTQGLKFMGQRFTPDAHIFQNLVYDQVTWYTGKDPTPFTAVFTNGRWLRGFPRGLDLMAVFGSEVAEQILKKENDAEFENYQKQFSKLKKQYRFEDEDLWTRDLYWSRLWAFKAILEEPSQNVPYFMRSKAWLKKQLNAALGSWAELKHDTILYTEQPYAIAQAAFSVGAKGGMPPPPEKVVRGYVEPVPALYERIREAAAQLRLRLTTLGFPPDKALESNFTHFEQILQSLERISKKELRGKILEEGEYKLIENIGGNLKRVLNVVHYTDVAEKFRTEMDNKMPIVADVFTDSNSSQVLEEAVGRPAEIFVRAKIGGKNTLCLGAAYAYYEFKQPMSKRLTDEEWYSMIEENKQPSAPQWMKEIAIEER